MTCRFALVTARPARRAIAETLPPAVAAAAVESVTGPLLDNPRRVGRALRDELAGIHSARLGTDWRVFYEIHDDTTTVVLLDVQHRSGAYRRRR